MRTTESPKSERVINIFCYLIRNKTRKYTAGQIHHHLSQYEEVSLRNVQRDLKVLAELPDCHVAAHREKGGLYYRIAPDMRDNLSLPIQRNAIMALFLLKKLQPFFAPRATTFAQIGEAIAQLSAPADYDLFEDFDEKLETHTRVLGEHAVSALDGNTLNNLLTALMEKRRCTIAYQGGYAEKPYETSICPVKLVMHKGELYFMCIAETKEYRDYWMKLCRITGAVCTDKTFHISPARMARIEKRLRTSSGILSENSPKPRKITLVFPSHFDRIFSEKRFHPTQTMKKDGRGDVVLTMHVPVDTDLVQWVLGWSDSVTVAGPKELKQRLCAIGKLLVKNNRG